MEIVPNALNHRVTAAPIEYVARQKHIWHLTNNSAMIVYMKYCTIHLSKYVFLIFSFASLILMNESEAFFKERPDFPIRSHIQ